MFDVHAIHAAAYSVAVDAECFRFQDANRAALELTGFSLAHQPGLTPHDIFPPEVASRIVDNYRACCAGEAVSYVCTSTIGFELRRWRTTLFPVSGADGRPHLIYGICSRLAATDSLDLPALALEALDGGFWTFDLNTRDFMTSRGLAEKIAGPGHVSLSTAEYVSHIHADDLTLEMPEGDLEVVVEFRVSTFDKRTRWMQTRRRLVRDASGRPTHVVGIVLDITDWKLPILRLEAEAATDVLTRVGNRRAFERAATRCFDDESESCFGVVVIDLDDFKPVNDRHGHRVGDDLLREAGRRLGQIVAPGELLARIGGDEFAVLLPVATPERLDEIYRQIDRAFFDPFIVDAAVVAVGASFGGAVRNGLDRSVGDVVARADRALYAAKDNRRRLIA